MVLAGLSLLREAQLNRLATKNQAARDAILPKSDASDSRVFSGIALNSAPNYSCLTLRRSERGKP
jgi:hypothetical protein